MLATQAEGRTLVHDWLYELRLFALEQLSGMGADLFLCDPHRIIVTGPRKLRGRPLDSRDLRSGMALIAAALAADGQSRLSPLETVERGYGRLVERLQGLGATVTRRWLTRRRRLTAPARHWQRPAGLDRRGAGAVDGVAGLSAAAAGGGGSSGSSGSSAIGASRVAADAERPQVGLGQIEHADDVRRQRQDDVGLRRSTSCCARTGGRPAADRSARECRRARCRSSSRISPASMFVSPSRSRITVLISRLPNVGSPPKPVPEMLVTAIFSVSVTSSS